MLSISNERAHCQLQENVQIVEIGPSKVKLWLVKLLNMDSPINRDIDIHTWSSSLQLKDSHLFSGHKPSVSQDTSKSTVASLEMFGTV